MPIYAYKCSNCGFEKDALQKMSDAPLTDCPSCGEPALKKQVTAAGFQLKGSGWYVTDFRNGNKPATGTAPGTGKDGGKEGGKDSGKDSGSEGAKDSAPAAKTDSAAPAASDSKPSSDSKPAAASTPAPSKPAASSGT